MLLAGVDRCFVHAGAPTPIAMQVTLCYLPVGIYALRGLGVDSWLPMHVSEQMAVVPSYDA